MEPSSVRTYVIEYVTLIQTNELNWTVTLDQILMHDKTFTNVTNDIFRDQIFVCSWDVFFWKIVFGRFTS